MYLDPCFTCFTSGGMAITLLIVAALVVNIVAVVVGFRGVTLRYKMARCVGALGVLMVFVVIASMFYVVATGLWKGSDDERLIPYSYWILGCATVGSVLASSSIVYKRYFDA